jgi:hypothetical protein
LIEQPLAPTLMHSPNTISYRKFIKSKGNSGGIFGDLGVVAEDGVVITLGVAGNIACSV